MVIKQLYYYYTLLLCNIEIILIITAQYNVERSAAALKQVNRLITKVWLQQSTLISCYSLCNTIKLRTVICTQVTK